MPLLNVLCASRQERFCDDVLVRALFLAAGEALRIERSVMLCDRPV